MARRPLVAANWKMNGLKASIAELEKIIAGARALAAVDLVVCPPATLIASFASKALGTRVAIGGQDCHAEAAGAYTGDISAEMLRDAGAAAVIVGHSERRRYHGETDAAVRAKAIAARRAGLLAIICIGETRAQRDAGQGANAPGRTVPSMPSMPSWTIQLPTSWWSWPAGYARASIESARCTWCSRTTTTRLVI